MKNYICKTTTEFPKYMYSNIKTPAGLGIYAGEVYVANELDESVYGNIMNYVPEEVTDVTTDDICIILNGNFEELEDGRRVSGDPNYGHYQFLTDEIATTVRLNVENLRIEISIDALEEGINPQVGGYLVPTNGSNKLTYVLADTEITAKNFLVVEALKSFRLGGAFGESFTGTVVCRTVSKVAPTYEITFDVNPTWATVEVYSSNGLLYTPNNDGSYSLPSGNYTYNVSARGYESVTDLALLVEDEGFEEPVTLVIDAEYSIVTLEKDPVDMDLTLYLDGDEVIENPNLTYSLGEGTYAYNASAEGYISVEDVELVIGENDLGEEKTVNVALDKSVSSIAVKTAPDKTTYATGEDLDLTGGEITVTYEDSTIADIAMTAEGVTVTGFDNTQTGTQLLTVTYRYKITSFDVIVE